MPVQTRKSNGGAEYTKRGEYVEENLDLIVRKFETLGGLVEDSKSQHKYCHAVGSGKHKAPHKPGSWIKVWEERNGAVRSICMFHKCENKATLGAHVQRASSDANDADWFIVPACASCNNMHQRFDNMEKTGPSSYLKPASQHRKVKVAAHTQGTLKKPGWLYEGSHWKE